MRKNLLILCALTLILASTGMVIAAYGYTYYDPYSKYFPFTGGWYTDSYYYDLTTNWDGMDVPLGATVVATAQTTNSGIDRVEFIWTDPDGQIVKTETVAVQIDGTYMGHFLYVAESTQELTANGIWTIQANFLDGAGYLHVACYSEPETRLTTLFVVPEIPLIGTAGASLAMFAGLAIKMKRKPSK